MVHYSSAIFRWEILEIIGGTVLFSGALEFPHTTLDSDGDGYDRQRVFLSIGPHSMRKPALIAVRAEKASTTVSGDLVSIRLRSCYSMR